MEHTDRYQEMVNTLTDGKRLNELEKARISLFATWASINDIELDDPHLKQYFNWLLGWGFGHKLAEMHVKSIRAKLDACNG